MTAITFEQRFRRESESVYAGVPVATPPPEYFNMSLLPDSPTRARRLLASFATSSIFLLAAPACFTGDDGTTTVVLDTTGTETDTGPGCEVGSLDCACTAGDACNAGLECTAGICTEIVPECGDGVVEGVEQCDDANLDNSDACTVLCMPPSCDDGIVSGEELAADCGIAACGVGCTTGEPCSIANDCLFPVCAPSADDPNTNVCQFPSSCNEYLEFTDNAEDGVIAIDPDGTAGDTPAFDVFCHMSKDGGGWTLVFVSSDDNVDTWTWNNRAKLATEAEIIGDLENTNLDFMSPAYHTVEATDLLFIHQPSDVWAHYGSVGMGGQSLGDIIAAAGSPVCNYMLGGNGVPLSGGTLTASGQLCDTDLYFNLGDHETDIDECMDFGADANTASFGPVWSADKGDGCPFDDPAEFALGPHGPCGVCPDSYASTEFNNLGYAHALNLNTGAQNAGENFMQIYVR